MKCLFRALLILALFLTATACTDRSPAQAAEFPAKTITLICPFSPGGGTDALTRKIAKVVEEQTGSTIIVENKVGGSGAVAFNEGALVKPDGYTLTISTVEIVLLPMANMTSYKVSDYKGIMRMNYDATALVARGNAPYNTLAEFIEYSKENPGKTIVYYGSFPAPGWLAQKMLVTETGVDINAVSGGTGGAAAQIQNLLGGHIDATFITPAECAAYLETGEIKVLAVAADERVAAFPDYPTFKELGFDVVCGTWRGVSAPKGTPDEIVKTLEKMFTDAFNSTEFQEFLTNMKFGSAYLNTADFNAQIQRETEEFAPIVTKFLN